MTTIRVQGADVVAGEFEQVAVRAPDAIERVMGRAGSNIQRDAREIVRAHSRGRYVRQYPRSISYDVTRDGESVSVEVGPDKERSQGALGNLLEYGSVNNAPMAHMNPAADREMPRTTKHLATVVGRLFRG